MAVLPLEAKPCEGVAGVFEEEDGISPSGMLHDGEVAREGDVGSP